MNDKILGCDDCGAKGEALRRIQLRSGASPMLCERCFEAHREAGDVDPADPRVEGGSA